MRTWLVACLLVCGCGSDTKVQPDLSTHPDSQGVVDQKIAADVAVPKGTFTELKDYDPVKGEVKVKAGVTAGVTKLELLAAGSVVATATASPWELTWDTTKSTDGIIKLALKATSGSISGTSPEMPVVVLNTGEEAKIYDWPATNPKVTVPKGGYVDQHLKFHYVMPTGVTRVISVVYWDEPGFTLELKIGQGECPDAGTVAAGSESATSPCMTQYGPGGTIPPSSMWFSHVQLKNPNDVLGRETPFLIRVYLLK